MPLAVSQIRGLGLPSIGFAERPFTTIPPRRSRFTRWENSNPYPNVPLAAMTGFWREILPTLTRRSTVAGRGGVLAGANELTARSLSRPRSAALVSLSRQRPANCETDFGVTALYARMCANARRRKTAITLR